MNLDSNKNKISELSKTPSELKFQNSYFTFIPITVDDLASLYSWRSDPIISKYLSKSCPQNMEEQIKWHNKYLLDPTSLYFIISNSQNHQQKYGYCQLLNIDMKNKSAEFGMVVAVHKLLGTGFGYKLLITYLQICFKHLGLKVVYGCNHPDNSGSNKFHESFIRSRKIIGNHRYKKDDQLLFELTEEIFQKFEIRICTRKRQWKKYFEIMHV